NQMADQPDVLVLTRGGGSAEDLAAFSTEQVTRAVAGSRVPTLVAIGHEIDVSLAELAADQRASTPSNAAELLVPDKKHVLQQLQQATGQLLHFTETNLTNKSQLLADGRLGLQELWGRLLENRQRSLLLKRQLIEAFNPQAALRRGYAI